MGILPRHPLPVRCPSCGTLIPLSDLSTGVNCPCPGCKQGLRLRQSYFTILLVPAYVGAAAIGYLFGLRYDALYVAIALGVLPVILVIRAITIRLFPPDVDSTTDLRSFLYDNSSARPPDVEDDDKSGCQ